MRAPRHVPRSEPKASEAAVRPSERREPMKRADAAAALRALPPGLRPLVERLCAAGDRLELGLHLVGGPVRDLLLGRPLLDVDLLVEGSRPEAASLLARAALAP